jgi:hypothetical protein
MFKNSIPPLPPDLFPIPREAESPKNPKFQTPVYNTLDFLPSSLWSMVYSL